MSQRPLSSLASRAQEDGSGTSWVPAGCPSRETGGKSLGWAHGEWSAEPKLAPHPHSPGSPRLRASGDSGLGHNGASSTG